MWMPLHGDRELKSRLITSTIASDRNRTAHTVAGYTITPTQSAARLARRRLEQGNGAQHAQITE